MPECQGWGRTCYCKSFVCDAAIDMGTIPVFPSNGSFWHFLTFILSYKVPLATLPYSVYCIFFFQSAKKILCGSWANFGEGRGRKLSHLWRNNQFVFLWDFAAFLQLSFYSVSFAFWFYRKNVGLRHNVNIMFGPQYLVYITGPSSIPKGLTFKI